MILAVAVLVGVVAAFAVWQYVDNAEERAYDNARLLRVYRVDKDVPKGLPGEQAISEDFVERSEIPAKFRPATALADIEEIRGKVALADLSEGQVLVKGMFVDPRQAFVTTAGRLKNGRVAVTVSMDQIRGVAGLIVPGDKVNVMVDDPTAYFEGPRGPTQYLYQNVEVIAVGQQAAPEAGATDAPQLVQSGLITLSVPPEAAARLAYVSSDHIYITLVAPDNVPVDVPPIDGGNLFQVDGLTPYPDEEL